MIPRAIRFFQTPFPFYLNTDRENGLMVLGISVFTLLFLLIFEPFGLAHALQSQSAPFIYSAIVLAVLLWHVLLIPNIFPRLFDDRYWTLGGFVLYNLWVMVTVAFFAALYGHYGLGNCGDSGFAEHLLREQYRVLAIGAFPVSAILMAIHHQMMVRTLRDVKGANLRLRRRKAELESTSASFGLVERHSSTISAPETNAIPKPIFTHQMATANGSSWSIQAETQDQLRIPLEDFLYAQAEDNYTRLYWMENERPKAHLMRLSLKGLEQQSPEQENVLRVHRSYLVNLDRVGELRGNASGYRLYLPEADIEIPVARNRSQAILAAIGESPEA